MGFKRWLARKGAPGSTARWAAKLYRAILDRYPDESLDDIMRRLSNIHYGEDAEGHDEIVRRQIDTGHVRGLAHLVVIFLIAEAGFSENTSENRALIQDVVTEELRKQGIPEDHIYRPLT